MNLFAEIHALVNAALDRLEEAGTLPGGLRVRRRAAALREHLGSSTAVNRCCDIGSPSVTGSWSSRLPR